jgi:hypothetical protein
MLLMALSGVAHAQPAPTQLDGGFWAGAGCNAVTFTGVNGPRTLMLDQNGNVCISGSISATTTGFAPATAATPLSVTSTTGETALPAGAVVFVYNTGANTAFVNLGTSGSVTATTSNLPISANSGVWLTVGSNTNLAAITSTSTTSLNLIGGTGLGTGMGGGGSGGGGSSGAGPVTPGAAASNSILGGCQYNLTQPSPATTNQFAVQCDGLGNLNVDVNTGLLNATISGPLDTNGNVQTIIDAVHQAAIPVKQPDVQTTGTLNANGVGGPYAITLGGGVQSVEWNVTGLTGAGAFITPKASTNAGSTYGITLAAIPEPSGATFTTFNTDQSFCTNVAAKDHAELLVTTTGSSQTVSIIATASVSQCPVVGVPTQFLTNNTPTTPHLCGSRAFVHTTSATDTQILAASGSTNIYVCDWSVSTSAADNVYLEKSSTGTCASPTQISQAWYGGAQGGKIAANSFYRGENTGASQQLCVNTSTSGPADITVYYDQY